MPMDEKTFLLQRIAEQRGEGRSWSEVAQELKKPVEVVRNLVWENEAAFLPLLRRARSEFLKRCCHEAVRTLQEQLKSKDEKIRTSSANCLLRFEMARMRYQTACRREALQREKAASSANRPAAKQPNVPNTLPATPPRPTPSVNASPAPGPAKSINGPVITSDDVLKWMEEKKVAG